MPNKNYIKGANAERELVNLLKKELKFPFASRTPGSKSNYDVVGCSAEGEWFVFQVKPKYMKVNIKPLPKTLSMLAWKTNKKERKVSGSKWLFSVIG